VWVEVVISIAISGLWALKNMMRVDHQGWFNNFSALYQMVSTLVIVITVITASQSLSTSEFVFTDYHNETGMNSVLYVCLIGLLLSSYGFSGYEAGAHMAEETKNAA
jgi:amino acid transporter